MSHLRKTQQGFSIIELLAVLTILGILAAAIIPRASSYTDEARREACLLNKGEIELQVQLWHRNQGSYPAANLSDVGADAEYFPEGLPTCPVDASSYTIDTTTGIVIGHSH